MKRFVKFGAILMVLAVAFVSCKHKVNGVKEEVKTTVTVRVVAELVKTKLHEFTLPIGDVATVKAGITAELKAKDVDNDNIIVFGEHGTYTINDGYYSENGAKLNTDDELLAVIKKGGIIIIRTDKL